MSDGDGGALAVVLTHDVYDTVALVQASHDFAPHLVVARVDEGTDETHIRLAAPRGDGLVTPVVDKFLNYLLDLSVRAKLGVQR